MTITRVKINTVDLNEQQAVSSCQIALVKAPNGNLWALYHDNDGGVDTDLYVAYSSDDGATWTEEEALAGGRPVLTGRTLALLVDSNSVPHIIFLGKNAADTFNGRIRYLNRVGVCHEKVGDKKNGSTNRCNSWWYFGYPGWIPS